MKHQIISTLSILISTLCVTLSAQSTTDAIMMNKRDICFVAAYEHAEFDTYWEGSLERTNGNIGTFTRTSIMGGFTYGILDRLNLLVGIPYVSTKSSGGQLAGVSGIQDLSIALKAEVLEKPLWKGKVYLLPVAEFSTPMSNYLSDYQPYSIGLHTDQFMLRAIAQYRLEMGLYVRGSAAHLWRGQTKIERDFYYNNGAYYSQWMDVPNAWNYQATAGIWLLDDALRIEGNYTLFRSTSGDDIRTWNAPQPTNKVEADQIGAFAQYYITKLPGLGVIAYYSRVLEGKNAAQMTSYGGGITYQFKLF